MAPDSPEWMRRASRQFTPLPQLDRFRPYQERMNEVTAVRRDGDLLLVETDGGSHATRALIVASGSRFTTLGVPGEEEFVGRGISHCAACDGSFFMRGLASPDDGDALALTFAYPVAKRDWAEKRRFEEGLQRLKRWVV